MISVIGLSEVERLPLGVVILGLDRLHWDTGLDVIRRMPTRFRVVGLAAGTNVELMEEQIESFRPKVVSLASKEATEKLKSRQIADTEIIDGSSGLQEMVQTG